jgi:hypothetical protein
MCGFRDHLNYLKPCPSDTSFMSKLKKDVNEKIKIQWKEYARHPSTGKKQMTARPLEDCIASALDSELKPLGVQVVTRKKVLITKDTGTIIDVILSKSDNPTSFISVKTWLASDSFRESFGDAYFIKGARGSLNTRFYIATLSPLNFSKEWIELARPYVDNVYSLSDKPYIDDLVQSLKKLYALA